MSQSEETAPAAHVNTNGFLTLSFAGLQTNKVELLTSSSDQHLLTLNKTVCASYLKG
jgi:hypothetical protein